MDKRRRCHLGYFCYQHSGRALSWPDPPLREGTPQTLFSLIFFPYGGTAGHRRHETDAKFHSKVAPSLFILRKGWHCLRQQQHGDNNQKEFFFPLLFQNIDEWLCFSPSQVSSCADYHHKSSCRWLLISETASSAGPVAIIYKSKENLLFLVNCLFTPKKTGHLCIHHIWQQHPPGHTRT